jgi:signal transduction histidine kinase
MDLSTFIDSTAEDILDDVVSFGRTLSHLADADLEQIRDHIPPMLHAITNDMRRGQSKAASIAKSHGRAAGAEKWTDADEHGKHRARSGSSIEQLLAEYRALRSSVLRLWSERCTPGADAIDQVGRFNEAIDQAIAESVRAYVHETETRRQLFLATVGHDLRSPLNAISLSAQALVLEDRSPLVVSKAVLLRSAQRMTELLDSLLQYNLVGLGRSITLQRGDVDLQAEYSDEVDILRAAFPRTVINFKSTGDCRGSFDSSRMREALGNLVSNATHHGAANAPINVMVDGTDVDVRLTVTNKVERPVPADQLPLLFEPLHRQASQVSGAVRTNLGLGLFIVREIASAHGGSATAVQSDNDISFVVAAPKV